MSPTPLLDDLLALATRVSAEAAALLVEGLAHTRSEVGTKTTDTDMVTEMDRASEALITEAILAARPDDGILGEEGAARAGSTQVRWVIDPIDGTTNYLYGLAGFAVSIAAEIDGFTAVGVVNDALHREVFSAIRGGGARLNGKPIEVSSKRDLPTALVATGFSYSPEIRMHQARVLQEVLPRVRDIRRVGAASVDLCSVACGRVDAYYESGLAPWDLAAGALIASEAGATLGDLAAGPPSGSFTLAANPALFGQMRHLLASAGAGEHQTR